MVTIHSPLLLAITTVLTVKVLLFPTYHSTDLEVHRHWMATTHTLPLTKWYTDTTSQWTLDYPPLFAWVEYTLGWLARLVEQDMLVLQQDPYITPTTKTFMRASVLLGDAAFTLAIWHTVKHMCPDRLSRTLLTTYVATSAALILVDNIHFQYNSLVLSVLVFAIHNAQKGQHLRAVLCCAILVHLRHTFLGLGPLLLAHFLTHYCATPTTTFSFTRFAAAGAVGLAVTVASLAPFASHLPQVTARLFPFGRGLMHAYWAPNFWPLYAVADMVVRALLGVEATGSSLTRGLVGEGVGGFAVLPPITPSIALVLVLLAQLPVAWLTVRGHLPFPLTIALGALALFLFGWHMHEKHLIFVIVPLSLAIPLDPGIARLAVVLQLVAAYVVAPLLQGHPDLIPRFLITWLHAGLGVVTVRRIHPTAFTRGFTQRLCGLLSILTLVDLGRHVLIPALSLSQRLPFLGLLLTSVSHSAIILSCIPLLWWNARFV